MSEKEKLLKVAYIKMEELLEEVYEIGYEQGSNDMNKRITENLGNKIERIKFKENLNE